MLSNTWIDEWKRGFEKYVQSMPFCHNFAKVFKRGMSRGIAIRTAILSLLNNSLLQMYSLRLGTGVFFSTLNFDRLVGTLEFLVRSLNFS